MDDVIFARSRLERVDSQVRGMGLALDQFAEHVQDLQAVWADRASQHVQDRYLTPHAAASQAMRDRCLQQLHELNTVIAQTQAVGDGERQLAALSEANTAARQASERERQSSARHVDVASNLTARADSQADEALALLGSI